MLAWQKVKSGPQNEMHPAGRDHNPPFWNPTKENWSDRNCYLIPWINLNSSLHKERETVYTTSDTPTYIQSTSNAKKMALDAIKAVCSLPRVMSRFDT